MSFLLYNLAYVFNHVYYLEKWLEKLGPANNKRTKSHGDPFLQSVYLDILKKSL